jgi:hypothetical protein
LTPGRRRGARPTRQRRRLRLMPQRLAVGPVPCVSWTGNRLPGPRAAPECGFLALGDGSWGGDDGRRGRELRGRAGGKGSWNHLSVHGTKAQRAVEDVVLESSSYPSGNTVVPYGFLDKSMGVFRPHWPVVERAPGGLAKA